LQYQGLLTSSLNTLADRTEQDLVDLVGKAKTLKCFCRPNFHFIYSDGRDQGMQIANYKESAIVIMLFLTFCDVRSGTMEIFILFLWIADQ
jgi:hypothetical protein